MNTKQIYDKAITPKPPPQDISPEEGLKAQQEAFEEQERQKWVNSVYTQRLMLYLEKVKHTHLENVLAVTNDNESSSAKNEYIVRKLTKVNTLNETIQYVITGKI